MTNIYFKPEKCFHLCRPSAVVVLNNSQKSGFLFLHTFIHVWNVAFIEVSCTASQINKSEPTLRLKRRDPVEVLVFVFFFSFPVRWVLLQPLNGTFVIRQFSPGYLLGLGAEKNLCCSLRPSFEQRLSSVARVLRRVKPPETVL